MRLAPASGPLVRETEVVFSLADPRRPRPPVDRFEYQLEITRARGRIELVCDPQNPLRAPGPFGDKSVVEFPGYRPPEWVEDEEAPRGDIRAIKLRAGRT